MRGIKDLFAQYERAVIRSRTKAALGVKKARGERVGEVPIGKVVDTDGIRLVEDQGEAAAVERVAQLTASGHSQRAIADALTVEGYPSRGARWHKTTVARIQARLAA